MVDFLFNKATYTTLRNYDQKKTSYLTTSIEFKQFTSPARV